MKLKDIAYELESVKKLITYSKSENGYIQRNEIPVHNAYSGESKQYFEYEIDKITPELKTSDSSFGFVQVNAYLVVYLSKEE